jgi:hypothetical protein
MYSLLFVALALVARQAAALQCMGSHEKPFAQSSTGVLEFTTPNGDLASETTLGSVDTNIASLANAIGATVAAASSISVTPSTTGFSVTSSTLATETTLGSVDTNVGLLKDAIGSAVAAGNSISVTPATEGFAVTSSTLATEATLGSVDTNVGLLKDAIGSAVAAGDSISVTPAIEGFAVTFAPTTYNQDGNAITVLHGTYALSAADTGANLNAGAATDAHDTKIVGPPIKVLTKCVFFGRVVNATTLTIQVSGDGETDDYFDTPYSQVLETDGDFYIDFPCYGRYYRLKNSGVDPINLLAYLQGVN